MATGGIQSTEAVKSEIKKLERGASMTQAVSPVGRKSKGSGGGGKGKKSQRF